MPINPIQLFQGSSNSLLDILNNGNDKITGILDRAIQIGRDNVNNQMKQESDMFGQRATETALAQRRAEGLQQNNEDAQRNARNAYEFDTKFQYGQTRDAVQDQQFGQKFEYGKAQDAIQNQRLSANDIFSQGMQQKNYELNSSNIVADNSRMDLQLKASQDAAAAKNAALQEAAQQTADVLGSSQTVPDDIQSAVGANKFSASSLFSPRGQADNRSKALKLAGNPYANSAQLKIAVDAVQPGTGKQPSAAEAERLAMQRTEFEQKQADLPQKQAEEKVKAERETAKFTQEQAQMIVDTLGTDSEPFPSPEKYLKNSTTVDKDGNVDPSKIPDKEDRQDLLDYRADPKNWQKNKALNFDSAEKFADKMKNSREPGPLRQKRIEFWNATQALAGRKTGEVVPEEKFTVGKIYRDANGNSAVYKGNGQWE